MLDWNATLFSLFQIGSRFDDVSAVGVAPPEALRQRRLRMQQFMTRSWQLKEGYEPIYVDFDFTEGASAQAAVVGAAHAAMVGLFPSQGEKEQLGKQLENL